MVKYYYNKYNSITTTTYGEPSLRSIGPYTTSLDGYWRTYQWDAVNKKFTNDIDDRWPGGLIINQGTWGYRVYSDGAYIEAFRLTETDAYTDDEDGKYDGFRADAKDATSKTNYSKGTLAQADVVAEDGTYPTNGRHTDGYWYVRGAVVNQNPIITTVGTVPSGSMEVRPSFNYKVTDPDGNTITVTESIDGITFNTRTGVTSGTQLTFTPTDLAWLRTRIKQTVNLTIKADDGKGGVTTVNYPITRTTPAIDMQLKTPFEADVAARRLLLKLEGSIPVDANVSVQVCNNAFDANPTWENATNLVLSGFPHPFTNKIKTAAKWGVSFKVRIERGNSTQSIYLDGVGGAFD